MSHSTPVNEDPVPTIVNQVSPIAYKTDYFLQGLEYARIPEITAREIGKKFTDIFENLRSTRNGNTLIEGAFFALGTKNMNPEWREHCAGSLREFVHLWKTNMNYMRDNLQVSIKKINGLENQPTIKIEDLDFFKEYYSYFSCVCHHEANELVIASRSIDGNQRKAEQNSDKEFIDKVSSFIKQILVFFEKYEI